MNLSLVAGVLSACLLDTSCSDFESHATVTWLGRDKSCTPLKHGSEPVGLGITILILWLFGPIGSWTLWAGHMALGPFLPVGAGVFMENGHGLFGPLGPGLFGRVGQGLFGPVGSWPFVPFASGCSAKNTDYASLCIPRGLGCAQMNRFDGIL